MLWSTLLLLMLLLLSLSLVVVLLVVSLGWGTHMFCATKVNNTSAL